MRRTCNLASGGAAIAYIVICFRLGLVTNGIRDATDVHPWLGSLLYDQVHPQQSAKECSMAASTCCEASQLVCRTLQLAATAEVAETLCTAERDLLISYLWQMLPTHRC